MKIIVTKNYQELCLEAGNEIISLIKKKPSAVLGLATGKTPLGLYQYLVQSYLSGIVSFKYITTFNLDEYVGLDKNNSDSFWHYMQDNFFSQIDIQQANINLLNGAAGNLQDEIINYERNIAEAGGIDLQILGIGLDGHIGFCEPGTSFESKTQIVNLTKLTLTANSIDLKHVEQLPTKAITMGIDTIMRAQKIILLASGEAKAHIIHKALYGEISEDVPASILQKHHNCLVFLDAAAAGN